MIGVTHEQSCLCPPGSWLPGLFASYDSRDLISLCRVVALEFDVVNAAVVDFTLLVPSSPPCTLILLATT